MQKSLSLDIAAYCHMGLIRKNNEDNLFIDGQYLDNEALKLPFQFDTVNHGKASLLAVCDGMGGEEFGEEASSIAVQMLAKYWLEAVKPKANFKQTLQQYFDATNSLICQKIVEKGKRMGTTLALLAFQNNQFTAVNIGDSRIYQYRNGKLMQISADHTQAQTLIRSGALKVADARNHASWNKLTQHLGIFPDELIIEPYFLLNQNMQDNDQWLICSDGLTDLLDDPDIKAIFDQSKPVAQIGSILVNTALNRGGHDNITVIVIKAKRKSIFGNIGSLVKRRKAG